MVRRLMVGTIAAAALLGGTLAFGLADSAQAQVFECRASFGGNAACGEVRFNESPDPREPRPQMQIAGQAQMPPQTGQASVQSASQAAPQAEAQPAGEE